MSFQEYDVVKVSKLLTETRHIDGTEGVIRQPQAGDSGKIVNILNESGDNSEYIVESVDQEGMTVWLADFKHSELEKE
jgi:hypothetical protein